MPDRPVYGASGVTLESAEAFVEADGFIVGSAFERDGRAGEPVDPARALKLTRKLHAMGSKTP